MRKIGGVLIDPDFAPRANADSKPIFFKKSMEGARPGECFQRSDVSATGSPNEGPGNGLPPVICKFIGQDRNEKIARRHGRMAGPLRAGQCWA
jgi:hypothetical protein